MSDQSFCATKVGISVFFGSGTSAARLGAATVNVAKPAKIKAVKAREEAKVKIMVPVPPGSAESKSFVHRALTRRESVLPVNRCSHIGA